METGAAPNEFCNCETHGLSGPDFNVFDKKSLVTALPQHGRLHQVPVKEEDKHKMHTRPAFACGLYGTERSAQLSIARPLRDVHLVRRNATS